MSIIIHQLFYKHSHEDYLLKKLDFSLAKGQKIALTGDNGTGKSTLLQLIAGHLQPTTGSIFSAEKPYLVPQHFGQYDRLNIGQTLQVDQKIHALHAILNGDISPENFALLDNDWNIEERCTAALSLWGLDHLSLSRPLSSVSGGEKSKIFLAGIRIHSPAVILMDEPSNHLDTNSRQQLYKLIRESRATLIVVSHDRMLMNLFSCIGELHKQGITFYGGDYDFYKNQKELQTKALQQQLDEKERELRRLRQKAQQTLQRKQKQDIRGKKDNLKQNTPKMAMHTHRDRAEKSSGNLIDTHRKKINETEKKLNQINNTLQEQAKMKIRLNASLLYREKIMVTAQAINFRYNRQWLWDQPLTFQIRSGNRYAITGKNGSGKTTLVRLILNQLTPGKGDLKINDFSFIYLDQDYSSLQDELTVFEQAQRYNTSQLQEHELKTILHRHLFHREEWDKACKNLSGGEKMRLLLCCLMLENSHPDLVILDEPTNNLDIKNLKILTNAIRNYQGTLLAISHDTCFLKEIGVRYHIHCHEGNNERYKKTTDPKINIVYL